MIKKLRQKFVIVTMLFMTIAFGGLLLVNNLSVKYWDEQELLHRMEWYLDSDSFFELDLITDGGLEEYDKPILALRLDRQLNILDIQSSSKTGRTAPTAEEISAIFNQPPEKHKWKSYLYIISEQPDGYTLLITDTSEGRNGVYRALGDFLLVCAGLLLLLLISLFLSRFVTRPAQEALEREKQFISDASHELKTPLAAISINAQALQADFADNRHLHNILSETKRMDALIQKLLKLSYMEEAGGTVERIPFSLSRCCEEMVLSMESSIYERKIAFRYEIEEDITCVGNEDDIKQVIAILLDNAMNYTLESGTIFFQLKCSASVPVVTVENSGQGILPEDMPHIFERFYRMDKSRNNGNNNYGLGLAIAKSILDAHGAKITVASEEGKGTSFVIEFCKKI